jgi:heme-degrading monooxygenase HmoA
MYSSTFIFAKKQFDEAFHQLDQEIAAIAKSIPGYLGEEAWENSQTGLFSNVYYWSSLEALQKLVEHPVTLRQRRLRKIGLPVIKSSFLRSSKSMATPSLARNGQLQQLPNPSIERLQWVQAV